MVIVIKRVYDPSKPSDGFRVLVDRLWLDTFRAELMRPKVTLLFAAHDPAINHASVLADYLRQAAKKPSSRKPVPGKRTQARLRARSR